MKTPQSELLLLLQQLNRPVKGQDDDDPDLRGSVPGYGRVGPSALSPLKVPKNQVLLQTGCHPGLQVGGKEFSQD